MFHKSVWDFCRIDLKSKKSKISEFKNKFLSKNKDLKGLILNFYKRNSKLNV